MSGSGPNTARPGPVTPRREAPAADFPAGGRRDLVGIQYLRGVAALMVVVYHLTFQMTQLRPGAEEQLTLRSGVDIFFVISGFVMVYSTAAGTRLAARTFLLRRLVRIVPLYWAATLAMIAILLLAPQIVKSSVLDPAHAALSLLFLAWPNPVGGIVIPLVTVGWTLNLEMLFYLIFAAAIVAGRRRAGPVLAIAAAPLVAMAMAGFVLRPPGVAGFYLNPILLEFLWGMGAAWAFLRCRQPVVPGIALLVPVCLAILILPPEGDFFLRCFRYGLPALVLIAAATFGAMPRSVALHRLGDISYSLYVSHFFTLSAFVQVWRRLVPGFGGWQLAGFYTGGTLAAIAVGYLCWRFVERPLTALANHGVFGARSPAPLLSLDPPVATEPSRDGLSPLSR